MRDIVIRAIELSKLEDGFDLIWKVFQEFVAPDYSPAGIDTFYEQFIIGEKFRDKFRVGTEVMYGAYNDDQLVGVLSISQHNTVSCVFVDGEYHRMGIGRKLLLFLVDKLREDKVEEITLNASPYAVPFYHALGFQDVGTQSSYHGIVYTPMKLML